MHFKIMAIFILVIFFSRVNTLYAEDVQTEGAKPGVWTMDLVAAKKLAKEKKLPLLLSFSLVFGRGGCCSGCKTMKKRVFTKKSWGKYAKENLVMVFIHFPRDKSKVPQKFVKRNDSLKKRYKVSGYPTYVVLDEDGETALGRLYSCEQKTVKSFLKEIEGVLSYTPAKLMPFSKKMKAKDKSTYLKLIAELKKEQDEIKEEKKLIRQAEKKIEDASKKLKALKAKVADFRAKSRERRPTNKTGPDEKRSPKERIND